MEFFLKKNILKDKRLSPDNATTAYLSGLIFVYLILYGLFDDYFGPSVNIRFCTILNATQMMV